VTGQPANSNAWAERTEGGLSTGYQFYLQMSLDIDKLSSQGMIVSPKQAEHVSKPILEISPHIRADCD